MITISASRPPSHLRPLRLFAALVALLFGDVMQAQTASPPVIAIRCIGSAAVDPSALAPLCADFHTALQGKYPSVAFQRPGDDEKTATTSVTLEAFAASASEIDLRLRWQRPDLDEVIAPRHGFSISDRTLSPEMRLKFITGVVRDTPLPF